MFRALVSGGSRFRTEGSQRLLGLLIHRLLSSLFLSTSKAGISARQRAILAEVRAIRLFPQGPP